MYTCIDTQIYNITTGCEELRIRSLSPLTKVMDHTVFATGYKSMTLIKNSFNIDVLYFCCVYRRVRTKSSSSPNCKDFTNRAVKFFPIDKVGSLKYTLSCAWLLHILVVCTHFHHHPYNLERNLHVLLTKRFPLSPRSLRLNNIHTSHRWKASLVWYHLLCAEMPTSSRQCPLKNVM